MVSEKTAFIRMAAVVALVIAVAPDRALARPELASPPPPATAPPETRTDFYGWQLFMVDGVLAGMALSTQRPEPAIALLISGPLIHGLHGRGDAAVGSLLLRATLPLLGLVVGEETCTERPVDDDLGCLDNIYIGLGVGLTVTLGLDYFALARKTVTPSPARVRPAVTVTPTASSAGVRFDF